MPPTQRPLRLEAAILSRMRSEVTSRSNWANDSSTFSVSRPIEVVVLNCWVTDTKDTWWRSNSSTSLAKSASDRVRSSTWHSWCRSLRLSVAQPKEFGPTPAGAGDRKRDLREAPISLAVPGKAFGQDRHPVHLPVPFSAQRSAGPEVCGTLTHTHGTLSGLLGRPRAIEQAYGLGFQVTQLIGLQPVGQDAKQQMAGQVRGRLPPEHGVPTAAKLADAEIAEARNLGVE